MFFDQGTPDTSVYMIAGYTIFFIVAAIYLVSLFLRARNLHRDLETLKELETQPQASAPEVQPAPAARKPKPAPAAKGRNGKPTRKKASRKR